MGGKVLDLPEIRIYKHGKAEGKAEGEEERKALADENKNLTDEINRLQQELDKYKNNNK